MRKLVLLAATMLGLAAGPVAAAPILDGYRVTVGGTTFSWTTTEEGGLANEVHVDAGFARTPRGFQSGVVVLTEQGGGISDEFALFSIPILNRLTAVFLSDPFLVPPVPLPVRTLTLAETGGWQPVGNFFGFENNNAVQVISDAAVPEPATLALLGAGFAGLGLTRRRARASTGSAG